MMDKTMTAVDTDDTTSEEPATHGKSAKLNIPHAEADLVKLTERVDKKWLASPWLSLQYTTQALFSEQSSSFKAIVEAKKKESGLRSPLATNLTGLNKEANRNLSYLKNYIADKYGKKAAPSYYAQFGIVKFGREYLLPFDGADRKDSLAMLPAALREHGLDKNAYGEAYWSLLKERYDGWYDQALDSDTTKSEKVGRGRPLKSELRKTLKSIVKVIEGNYPDTFPQELRAWGFLKERQ